MAVLSLTDPTTTLATLLLRPPRDISRQQLAHTISVSFLVPSHAFPALVRSLGPASVAVRHAAYLVLVNARAFHSGVARSTGPAFVRPPPCHAFEAVLNVAAWLRRRGRVSWRARLYISYARRCRAILASRRHAGKISVGHLIASHALPALVRPLGTAGGTMLDAAYLGLVHTP